MMQQPMMGQPMMGGGQKMVIQDGQPVQFMGQVSAATYGPQGSHNNMTQQVNGLIQRGQMMVQGGIHTAIGDPAPGVPKLFKVWYKPDFQCPDGQPVQFMGPVSFATYGPEGQMQNDVTDAVNGLIQRGQMMVHGGIHTQIGDPNPGVPKMFKVYY